jgi:hypothetical protein
MKRPNRQNRPIGLVAVLVVLAALLIAGTIAVERSNHMALAKKGKDKKNDLNIGGNKIFIVCRTAGVNSPVMGQSCNTKIPNTKISQNKGTEIHIVCETAGANSPIMDQSCNGQLTKSDIDSTGIGNAVPMIIPFGASG